MQNCKVACFIFLLGIGFFMYPKVTYAACGVQGAATGDIYYVDGIDGIVGWAENNDGTPVGCVDYYIYNRGQPLGSTPRCTDGSIPAAKTTNTLGTSAEAFPRMTSKNGNLFSTVSSCISNLTDGEYDLYLAVAPNTFAPGPFQFSIRTINTSQNARIWAHYLGVVVSRGNTIYDSYPTIMKDGNTYKMWYASSVSGDSIFYATSVDGITWSLVTGPLGGGAVLEPTQNNCTCSDSAPYGTCPAGSSFAPDDMHTADPSVIKIGSTYYMYYTGASKRFSCFGSANNIFLATSADGVHWQKRLGGDGKPLPVITSQVPCTQPPCGYGTGQSTVLIKEITGDGVNEIIQYFTDLTTGQMGHSVAISPVSDGVNFARYQNGVMGDLTWDTKYSNYLNEFISFDAIPTNPGVAGYILLAQSLTGQAGSWSTVGTPILGRNVLITMDKLTVDTNRWVVHNPGIVGDPTGIMTGRNTFLYFGSGYGMQPYESTWDIAGVDLWLTKNLLPTPTPSPSLQPSPSATPQPSPPRYTTADLKNLLTHFLGSDAAWWNNDGKTNMLDAAYVISWIW